LFSKLLTSQEKQNYELDLFVRYFKWTYTAGNNWGICPDGSGALGCRNQETFRACSDVIVSGSGTG
jgi:hypothetical protein